MRLDTTAGPDPGALPGSFPGGDLGQYCLAVALCPMPALLCDPEGLILAANPLLERMLGYDESGLSGLSVTALIPEPQREGHAALMQAFHQLPRRRSMNGGAEVSVRRRDGALLPVEVLLNPVQVDQRALTFTAFLDTSARRRAERRLRDVLNAAATAMILVDETGRIRLVNAAACTLLGGPEEALLEHSVDHFLPPDLHAAHRVHRANYHIASSPRAMAMNRPLKVVGLDGVERPVNIALRPVETESGQRVVATIYDLSETFSYQQELKSRADGLAALNEELTQFAYSASHDLRAPLATISGLLDLCLEDLEAGDTAECRRNIHAALETSQRNIHKVEAVLTLARAGMQEVPVERMELDEAVAGAWSRLTRDRADAPGFVIDCDGPVALMTERRTLLTAIENLLSNALRFHDPERDAPWVAVRIRTRARKVSICVSDNGLGIPDTEQPRVFEMFRRSARSEGHGLGLSLVMKHVRRLGGLVSLSSSPSGTDVILSFDDMEVLS
ncbi:PAS domain-containing sensor histidine kinase [Pseudooceanicola sp. CBS1P-1]|uniref:histidine kinase n=1 Tax=Pseudooceanicola albus TaxID=2692189 RepID=A0A6L7FZP4_9RHOB|nr:MULTISPECIES: PAS domain-containing sensor histidine kinase [Pseudooceanicola]MBT9382360.1 PAS domain-containing sensor histidine kinase [Pseudooceanicola endophyticus]MXN16902.1 PAS domain S-box protein [Pseudooceanicola albus]